MNRRNLILGASALGLAAFAGGTVYISRQRAAEAEAQAALAAAAPPADNQLLIRAYSPTLGPADAKVTLVEFFDPSCEACRAFHPLLKEMRDLFPDDLRIVMRYAAFHEGSDEAVRILEAARRQDLFEPVLNALLENQPAWAVHGSPQMQIAWQVAGSAGMDLQRGQADRLNPEMAGVLNQDAADIQALGVNQTPTFYLDGRRLENVSFESLAADIRGAVQG
ncbi:disulfide bond formation protein DsbA [Paracoccus sp. M683]|uniref:DsbA family protein n=1 Tax=Paracoccus sp. M683 TaxID=2594268 RepID=UPI00117E6101|nr:thioredoxin domain-containing protein [Paracoccus sp. M683]TRW96913.1 disulfide bond formation protein DsbA [Paracoccus sp. M683]